MSEKKQEQKTPRSSLGGKAPEGTEPPPSAPPAPSPTPDADKAEKDARDLALAEELAAEGAPESRRVTTPDEDAEAEGLTPAEKHRMDLGLPRNAPQALVKAAEDDLEDDGTAEGKAEATQGEVAVLDFLLGPTKAIEYEVDAAIDTDKGQGVLTFGFRQIRDSRIEELEEEYTSGEGGFAKVDRKGLNAAKVAEAVIWMQDRTGKKVMLADPEFMGEGIGDPADAVRARFQYQPGVLINLAAEIDAAAGMTSGRMGFAKVVKAPSTEEALTSAVGKS